MIPILRSGGLTHLVVSWIGSAALMLGGTLMAQGSADPAIVGTGIGAAVVGVATIFAPIVHDWVKGRSQVKELKAEIDLIRRISQAELEDIRRDHASAVERLNHRVQVAERLALRERKRADESDQMRDRLIRIVASMYHYIGHNREIIRKAGLPVDADFGDRDFDREILQILGTVPPSPAVIDIVEGRRDLPPPASSDSIEVSPIG